jgi:hypothetical protein
MSDRLVPVANFRTRLAAELAATALKAAGVPFLIQSAEGMGYGPLPPGADIRVHPSDAARARTILSESGVLDSDQG